VIGEQIRQGQKTIEFGQYTWRVLSIEDNKALLITENIIDIQAYSNDSQQGESIWWDNCSLRQYLNGEFYSSFNSDERKQILPTHLVSVDSSFGTPGGNETDDLIFLLSLDEAVKYFVNDYDRIAGLTDVALDTLKPALMNSSPVLYDSMIANVLADNAWYWWLRTVGFSNRNATSVNSNGSINENGSTALDACGGVRPVLYINLNS
jgi:hypothetical protein